MNFSEQLKKIRKDRNLTQQEMADKLGISRQAISNWENDKNLPDIEMLIIMAQTFDVTLDELILGDHRNNNMTEKLIKDSSDNARLRMNLLGIKMGASLMALSFVVLLMGFFVPYSLEGYIGGAFIVMMVCGVITFLSIGLKNISDTFRRNTHKRTSKVTIAGVSLGTLGVLIYGLSLLSEIFNSYIGFICIALGIILIALDVIISSKEPKQ